MNEKQVEVTRVTATEVLVGCCDRLAMPRDGGATLDKSMLAALARRSAGIHCPCSRATLRNSLLECLYGLPTEFDSLRNAIDDVIEALIVGGDLLELADVVIDDSDLKQTWVFAAPPSFVVRPSGSVFLIGIVADQDVFLPSTLAERVLNRGSTRILEPQPEECLPDELRELGLQQLSDRTWLRAPRIENSAKLLSRHQRLLDDAIPITDIPELQILDFTRPVTYYRGRWASPIDQNGMFVARRPQEFGAPIWCLVELENGEPTRLLDLPLPRTRWRGCDAAWHIQAAIDHSRNMPQRYRYRAEDEGIRFDFFSPLPLWSERRFMILGKRVAPDACLFSYLIPTNEADAEEVFLQRSLWLSRDDGSR
ncbi:MAG: hypothetical protein F4234_04010 [Gammaproteobacteria bacterium]|nr:hypothetical protein [Gammaproteobacteria bacterium]